MSFCKILCVATLILLSGAVAHAEQLSVAWGDYDVAPFVLESDSKLTGGIIKDIGDALAAKLALQPEYLMLPRKRMAEMVLSGRVHMRIGFNQKWVEQPERFHWTPALFEDTDILVIKGRDKNKFAALTDFYSSHIGAIMGHVYPDFENYFELRVMVRDNSINMDTNLIRLEKDRINAVLTTQMAFEYVLTRYKGKSIFIDSGVLHNKNTLSVMVSPEFPGSLEQLDEAITQLRTSGGIAEILAKYR